MDFTTRQPMAPSTDRFAPADKHHEVEPPAVGGKKPEKPKKSGSKHKETLTKGVLMVFLLCIVILVAALLLFIGSGDRSHETRYVDTSSFQVVEVAGSNQPARYFGNITAIADNYIVLDNAYAAVSSTTGTNPVSVLPLACTDVNGSSELVLNRSRIILWDNLAANSNAGEAIKEFKANNPGGQCPSPQLPAETSTKSGESTQPSGAKSGGSNSSASSAPTTRNNPPATSTDKNATTASPTSPRPQTP